MLLWTKSKESRKTSKPRWTSRVRCWRILGQELTSRKCSWTSKTMTWKMYWRNISLVSNAFSIWDCFVCGWCYLGLLSRSCKLRTTCDFNFKNSIIVKSLFNCLRHNALMCQFGLISVLLPFATSSFKSSNNRWTLLDRLRRRVSKLWVGLDMHELRLCSR